MPDDIYAVTVDGPDGTRVCRLFGGAQVRQAAFGPEQPHAKAALMASIDIQSAFERGDLGPGAPTGEGS